MFVLDCRGSNAVHSGVTGLILTVPQEWSWP